MWDPYAEFEKAVLPNGLTVHVAHWSERPWESVGFLVHSGAEHDPVGLEGLAHYVEHLISENAPVSKKNIEAFFEETGGSVCLGMTGYPSTSYRCFVPIDKVVLTRVFSIFGKMLLCTKLERAIERERQVINGEFRRSFPLKFAYDLKVREQKALYAGYWLERFVSPLGAPDSIGRITRADLQSYYDTHYTPANMSIVCIGGKTLSEITELLLDSPFAMSKVGVRTPLPIPVVEVSPLLETHYVMEMSKHFTVEAKADSMEYETVARIPGSVRPALVGIMGAMFDEVLNEEVREQRAWAYAINSSASNFRRFYGFSINCNGLDVKVIDKIEEVVEVCIASMIDREDLFEQTKRRNLAGVYMMDPRAKDVCDESLEHLSDFQRIRSLREYCDELSAITMGEMRDVLRWLRPEQRWTIITKP